MDGNLEATSERILLEPYKYLLQLPGKQVRTKLSQAFNHWLNVPEDKLQVIIQVTEMLHNDIKRYCVDYLEKVGSFAYTRQTLRDLEAEVYRLIGEFGGNPQLESLVKHLSQMHREAEATAESSTEPDSNQNH
ncbi:geranylgeranyl pyrophosphate synthase [Etheostoma cragini]|uniref:geranylgeranyl pyrophosphate synthase n=1 Tax=Etheostoma cragini TaxID=417921 RepID=UPI00155F1139|nr:geranylgeranyl pyrophosphate synthase [Etheostoma cragini]